MENELNKGKDMLRDLGDGLNEIGQKLGKKLNDMMDSFSGEGEASGELRIRSDVYETGTHFVIELELPGVVKKQVKIAATDNILTVKGDKERGNDGKINLYFQRERRFGSFMRSFELPDGISLENIKAKFSNGLLTIKFPKLEPEPEPESDSDASEIEIE